MAELLPEWKYVGASGALARRYHRCLREQICRSNSRRWMPKETRSSIRKWLKIAHGLQRNYHSAAQCVASDLSWFAVRPSWISVPRREEELIAAGLGPYLKKCFTITGGGCRVDAPVYLKLFLGKSLSFLDEQGRKTAPRPVEKVQIEFTKSYFAARIQ